MTDKFVLDNSPAGKRPRWVPVVPTSVQGVLFDQLHWERADRSLFEGESDVHTMRRKDGVTGGTIHPE